MWTLETGSQLNHPCGILHLEIPTNNSCNRDKNLGILIDKKLSFNHHILVTCGKATRILHMLMRNLKKATTKTRVTAYKTLCRPILEYACHSWSPHLSKYKKLLESINRKAFRWCFCLRKYDHISDLMLEKDWPLLETRRANCDLKMRLWILSNKASVDSELFLPHQSVHETRFGGTRGHINTNCKKYCFPFRMQNIFQKS